MGQKIGFLHAIPFWASLGLVPALWVGAVYGGWALLVPFLCVWVLVTILDITTSLATQNEDPNTEESQLFWHKLITIVWPFVQFLTLFGVIAYVTQTGHLTAFELVLMSIGLGIVSGAVGINYAHELMHQSSRMERWLADLLMAMAMYGHFRSEHLLVHHRYVGTPKDPVTARYNEGFHRFLPRVLIGCLRSAWQAEAGRLTRKSLPVWHRSNPFWRYGFLQLAFALLATATGGWAGLGIFLAQAVVAVFHLELVNYIEHYGLTRKHLGGGKYEHTKPHHSWNAAHRASNWLLINLQRHSDHHFKPDRRFPVLQTYSEQEAPQLPYSYPMMGFLAMVPPLWRRRMNPKVRAWRKNFYPEITDWEPYKRATNPLPR